MDVYNLFPILHEKKKNKIVIQVNLQHSRGASAILAKIMGTLILLSYKNSRLQGKKIELEGNARKVDLQ